jgi:primosomal protein N' (replication factor Y)
MNELQTYFVDVILPLSVNNTYTYRVPNDLIDELEIGKRVIVQFGRGAKLYTGIIKKIHHTPPQNYEAKYIDSIIDDTPIVHEKNFELWQWLAKYYLCSEGDVMKAALPSALKLASETVVLLNPDWNKDVSILTDNEYLIVEALQIRGKLSLDEISNILSVKHIHRYIKTLVEKKVIITEEEIHRKYKPRYQTFVKLSENIKTDEDLKFWMDKLQKASKQLEAFIAYLQLSGRLQGNEKPVNKLHLQNTTGATSSTINQLVKKGVFSLYEVEVGRLSVYDKKIKSKFPLSNEQQLAYNEIKEGFSLNKPTLLFGVTGSGKTEIYIELIEEAINKGKQVLYLLPEIALTTQLITRLQKIFGDKIGVYHSKFNENERVEIWNEVLHFKPKVCNKFQIILGARSALFLPYKDLGLIVVDEEHENSFKQYDPAPRYNARDTAIVLAGMHKADILLGSATPSLESWYNAKAGKYHLVKLLKRYGGIQMPEILIADIKSETKKKKMKSEFSSFLLQHFEETINNGEQVILFQNRRGFAPFLICEDCGYVPHCNNCDVSLTYHKYRQQLVCHYCAASHPLPQLCASCGSNRMIFKGFGTEKIEDDLQLMYPDLRIARMDLDTTRTKSAYAKIIQQFEEKAVQVLIGTQMVTKGLDFENVGLVGILDADSMLNFPDFRASERAFQLMVQVAGRAGRKHKRGKVVIQTLNPYHDIIQKVMYYKYEEMAAYELSERKSFLYPPYYRLIKITLKHKEQEILNEGSIELANDLKSVLGENRVIGPDFPLISRIRNYYVKDILIKMERTISAPKVKEKITEIINRFNIYSRYKSCRVVIDVDPN